jgi:hypothetical protein
MSKTWYFGRGGEINCGVVRRFLGLTIELRWGYCCRVVPDYPAIKVAVAIGPFCADASWSFFPKDVK